MEKEIMLRNALKANGAFSMLSALVALAFGGSVLAVNEMANGNSLSFAIQLFPFAAFVLFNAFRRGVSKVMIIIIIFLDVLYVVGAVVKLALVLPELSFGGILLILISVVAVSTFATFQSLGLRKALAK